MNEQKNLILAIVLSALVLFGWSFISERYFPTANPPATVIKNGDQIVLPKPGADPAADAPAAVRDRREVLAESPRVRIDTPTLQGTINLKGARIDDLVLTRYRETIKKGSPPIRLLSPSGAPKAYFAQLGWTGAGAPPADAQWTASSQVLAPGRPVQLSWTSVSGQRYEIDLAVDDKYMFTATQRVINRGQAAITVRPFALVSRTGASPDPDSWTVHVGPMGVFDDRVHDIDYDDLTAEPDGALDLASTGGWLGFSDQYWLTAVVPDQQARIDATFRHASGGRFQADFAGEPQRVAPGRMVATTSRLFAGAKEVQALDSYREKFGIPQFDKAIDWGWFYFLTKPIFYVLDWLFRLFGNFGVAIIGLTIIVRLLMFPIANKQFASMARMRIVAPKMKEVQERYKDDRVRMQQEMMALYAKEKVNPLAGCLPILLQIPIFYALYKTLMLTIEMRHQPFVLWIKDLSAPDPLTPINLFGLLPFTPPQFIAIGVLPIFLGVTMWLQQKLNPAPMDEMQQKMFAIMPWVFMFIMAPFATGLVVYWITNNTLSIAQQAWLYKRHGAPTAAPAK